MMNFIKNGLKKILALLKDYSLDNIYNANEMGLFFKALLDETEVFKGETCHKGKWSKEQVTLLLP